MNQHATSALNHLKQVTYLITRRTEAQYIRNKLGQEFIDLEREADLEVRYIIKLKLREDNDKYFKETIKN